ncbi:MAG: putative cytokinetic ring protein SteA, partial [Mycobacteriales bacterium]
GSAAGERGSTVSDKALRTSREVVLHADRSGRAIGGDRLARLGVRSQTLSASGASADMALLLADVCGASLIVTVGTHATLDEFLDRQRAGLASTFLTRLRVGPKLVDAKGVPQLYAGRVRLWHLALVLLAGLVALGVAIATTPVGQQWWSSLSAGLSAQLSYVLP